jgi:hypothetical protein
MSDQVYVRLDMTMGYILMCGGCGWKGRVSDCTMAQKKVDDGESVKFFYCMECKTIIAVENSVSLLPTKNASIIEPRGRDKETRHLTILEPRSLG